MVQISGADPGVHMNPLLGDTFCTTTPPVVKFETIIVFSTDVQSRWASELKLNGNDDFE